MPNKRSFVIFTGSRYRCPAKPEEQQNCKYYEKCPGRISCRHRLLNPCYTACMCEAARAECLRKNRSAQKGENNVQ